MYPVVVEYVQVGAFQRHQLLACCIHELFVLVEGRPLWAQEIAYIEAVHGPTASPVMTDQDARAAVHCYHFSKPPA